MAVEYDAGRVPQIVLDYFRQKGWKIGFSYMDVWKEEHQTAFTVAKAMELDLLAAIREAVDRSLAEGATFAMFQKDLMPTLQRLGWWGHKLMVDPVTGEEVIAEVGTPRRLKIIYDTNMRVARSVGQWQRIQRHKDILPYLLYLHGPSREPRPEHLAWHGLLLPADDPFWQSHYPPSAWGCFLPGTLVATPDGWEPIDSLRAGGYVYGGSGYIQPIESVQARPFQGEIIWVATKEGHASATPNHRLLTLRGWVRAENLMCGDLLVQIPQVAELNKVISHIKHPQSPGAQLGVSQPFHASRTPTSEAFDSNIQVGQEYIYPVRKDAFVKDSLKSPFSQLAQHHGFCTGRRRFGVWVSTWVGGIHRPPGFSLFSYPFRALKTWIFLQLFRHLSNGLAVLLGFSESVMAACRRLLKGGLAQDFRCLLSAGFVINPLDANPLTGVTARYAEMPHQADHSPVATSPSFTQIENREPLFEVEDPEGFVSGSPLDLFDSLESFGAWARTHGMLSKVTSIRRLNYIGSVYDLSIANDASYCLNIGVVHNCKCRVRQVTKNEYQRLQDEGIPAPGGNLPGGRLSGDKTKVQTQAPPEEFYSWTNPRTGAVEQLPKGVDPGWDWNPGASRLARAEKILQEKQTP